MNDLEYNYIAEYIILKYFNNIYDLRGESLVLSTNLKLMQFQNQLNFGQDWYKRLEETE